MPTIPARVIANLFMLTCFAGTIFFGLYNGNGWMSIMGGATLAAVIAWVVGYVIGAIALRSVNEQIERHRADNPIPGEDQITSDRPDKTRAAIG